MGNFFVGQVFSEFVLAIDIETHSIVKRIIVPGGGEGAIAASPDGRYIYFASNRVNRLFIIDSATYEYQEVDYPAGGRGCMCLLPHPSKPLLYVGIQRGGSLGGTSYSGGNCFLATFHLTERRYVGNLYLAELMGGRSDDSTPICLTYDEEDGCLFVGMFQSQRGICRVDELGREILSDFRFSPNTNNKYFPWVDPLSQALYRDKLLSVNRNNCELVTLDKRSGRIESATFLGDAPNGPRAVVVVDDVAIVSYPARQGLIFHSLCAA
jgi:WD40 repeat protein